MKDLSIVIVNWNGGPLLLRCLDSIRASRSSATVDVIVVDNHSADGSREAAAAAFPEFRLIDSGANLGFGRANNLARGLVDSRLVLFLNPDTVLMEDSIEQAVRCLDQHPDVGALGCRMRYPDGRVQELGLQWDATPLTILLDLLLITTRSRHYLRRWLPTIDPNRSGEIRKLYGGFMMIRKEVLDAGGWFDERYFMYAEDADLSRTLRALGWRLYYCSEATIMHVTGGTTAHAPSAFSTLMKQESMNRLIRKYQGPRAALLHRVGVAAGGTVRLGAVLLGRLVVAMSKNEEPKAVWKASSLKHQQLILWALGLREASVPVSPSAPPVPY